MSIFNRHVQPGTGRTLTDAEFLGLGFTVAAAALSALSVLALLAHIFRRISTIRYNLRLGRYCYLQVFFLSLLLSDLLLSVGTLISIMWILDGGVSEGPLCTAQAIIRQAGQLGVAWATLAITIGTWGIIVRGWSQLSGQHVILPYTGIWIFIITLSPLLLVIPRDQPFFGKTNYWCWIRPSGGLRDAMAFNIGWVWFCAFVNLIAYISAASSVLSKGATLRGEVGSRQNMLTVAFQMTWYPLVYLAVVVPMSTNRVWTLFQFQHDPPISFTISSMSLYTLSGFLNVALFTITRPNLIPKNLGTDPT